MEPKPSPTHLLVQCIWGEAEWSRSSQLPASWCPSISSRSFSASLPPGPRSKLTLAFGVLSLEPSGLKVTLVKAPKWKLLSPVWLFATPWTVHGILQAKILEWVAFFFSRGSSKPRDQTQVSRIAGGFFTSWVYKGSPKAPKSSYIVVQSCIH